MSAPLRIVNPEAPMGRAARAQPQEGLDAYLNSFIKIIPTPVVALFQVGNNQIPEGQGIGLLVWFVVCLIGVIALLVYGTRDAEAMIPPDWTHVALSAIAFILWAYMNGGFFEVYNLHVPWIGSLLMLAFSFFAPLYKGAKK
jgi:hypothetical protein